MKKGFDNDKYLQMQSEHIRERIAQFDNKLYLEFGGSCSMTTTPPACCPASSPIPSCRCCCS